MQPRNAPIMGVVLLLLGLAALLALPGADAHGYRDKSRDRPIPEHRSYFNHKPVPQLTKKEMPAEFNWCDNDGTNFCVSSWNQHIPSYCGGCWAHGTLSAIQDRLKIRKDAKGYDVMLGRQTLFNCAAFEGYGQGCDGGDTVDVFGYMTEFGLPDEGCMPYNASDHTKFPHHKHCPPEGKCLNCMPIDGKDTCWPVKRWVNYYLNAWGKVEPGVEGMMSEIYHRGPITCGVACPDDFTWNYKGGVFRDTSGDTELDHDVEVVGWGEEDGVPYWLVRNSWGAYWGELGFFRVERGVNAIQIESGDCWYGEPEHHVEDEVVDGEVHGSMWGLVDDDDEAAADEKRAGKPWERIFDQDNEDEEDEDDEERAEDKDSEDEQDLKSAAWKRLYAKAARGELPMHTSRAAAKRAREEEVLQQLPYRPRILVGREREEARLKREAARTRKDAQRAAPETATSRRMMH